MQKKIARLSQSGLLLAVILAVQIIGLPNPVTGIIVNAVLIFVSLHLGLQAALLLAFLSPVGGMISGHLPIPLYPLMPVIVCGNFTMIILHWFLKKHSSYFRLLFPALLKGLIIGGAGYMIVQILQLGENGKWLLLPVLGLQFFTAFGGIMIGEKISNQISKHNFS